MFKIKYSILGLCFLGVLQVLSNEAKAFDYSLLGGLTLSNSRISGETPSSTQSTFGVGFGVGGLVSTELSPYFNIESGVILTEQSFKLTSAQLQRNVDQYFLNFPLLFSFVPLSQVAFYAGPYYGVPLTSNVQSDLGLLTGFGYRHILNSSLKLRFDFFYQYGLKSLSESNVNLYARNMWLLAGVVFETW